MRRLRTIGYEGASQSDFDATLTEAGVDVVVDVRAVASSRRAGFSKTALSTRLKTRGVDYVHLRGLGDPKPGREAARAGLHDRFLEIYTTHLRTAAATSDLAKLAALAVSKSIALLCYEADAAGCHRAIVAEEVARIVGVGVDHLRVEGDAGVALGGGRTDSHPGQGLAAA